MPSRYPISQADRIPTPIDSLGTEAVVRLPHPWPRLECSPLWLATLLVAAVALVMLGFVYRLVVWPTRAK